MVALSDRFEAKVDRSGPRHLWLGSKTADSTGKLKVNGVAVTARRVAWELAYGPLDAGVEVKSCPERKDLRAYRTPVASGGAEDGGRPVAAGCGRECIDDAFIEDAAGAGFGGEGGAGYEGHVLALDRLPSIRLGRRVLVPLQALYRMLEVRVGCRRRVRGRRGHRGGR